MKKRAFFITLEGSEGSGKSTHLKFLADFFRKRGFKVETFREPGSTFLGEKIRKLLLYSKEEIFPLTELFLYLSARAQFVEEKLKYSLRKSDIVISDRFSDSTLVYQGYALGLGMEKIEKLVRFACKDLKPDITFVLDVEPKKGLRRIKRIKDRIEKRPFSFHYRLRRGYKVLAKKEPGRIKIIKAKSINYVRKRMLEYIEEKLKCKRK